MAEYQERTWPPIPEGAVILPDGCGWGMDCQCVLFHDFFPLPTNFQDWHIDFAGSSVYYHILRGSKVCLSNIISSWPLALVTVFSQTFLFIRPTASNLSSYERWSGSEIQSHTWLGDMVDEVAKVELRQGNTMIIPTGWIHAVVRCPSALC